MNQPKAPLVQAEPFIDEKLIEFAASSRSFTGAARAPLVTLDGKSVIFLRALPGETKQMLYEQDLASGKVNLLLSPDKLSSAPENLSPAERARRERMRISARGFAAYSLSPDGTKIALSLAGGLYVYNRVSAQVRQLPVGGGGIVDPRFSPDSKKLAYVRGYDLYVIGADVGQEVALTRGGSETKTYGLAEFIAQEELRRFEGYVWSPDSKAILYEEADNTGVEQLTIADPARPERAADRPYYPRPGKANAKVRFGVVSANGGATKWLDWDAEQYPYVGKVVWQTGAPPTLYLLNRLQNNNLLVSADPNTGKTMELLRETDSTWVNQDASVPEWLPDGSAFLWASEQNGSWQLQFHDRSGKLVRALTPPEAGYRSLLKVDEQKRVVYFAGGPEPSESGVYQVSLDAGPVTTVLAPKNGQISAKFSFNRDLFVSSETSSEAHRVQRVRYVSGQLAAELPANAAPPLLPKLEITRVGSDGVRVSLVRPQHFKVGKRYPILELAYAGPHVNVVAADADKHFRAQWFADATDAVVVQIDTRGTPCRGRSWERAIHHKLGSVPLNDHIAALGELVKRYPELDGSRIGVSGWSFGGYYAALAVLARPDVYKVAVAGAPPADWRDYDTAYTERYMGLPAEQAASYDAESLLTLAAAPKKATQGALLVVHGTADDNVYFMNSIKLVDAMQKAGRSFEFWPLLGTTHMPVDPEQNRALWLRSARFLREQLWK